MMVRIGDFELAAGETYASLCDWASGTPSDTREHTLLLAILDLSGLALISSTARSRWKSHPLTRIVYEPNASNCWRRPLSQRLAIGTLPSI